MFIKLESNSRIKMSKFIQFFKENRPGAIIGSVVCFFSLLIFFTRMPILSGFDNPVIDAIVYGNVGFLVPWMMIFYSLQQIMLFTGITNVENYSSSFFAIYIMPLLSFVLTGLVFMTVGVLIQKLYKKCRKQAGCNHTI